MVVDVVFPGWMPWLRFAVAHDVQRTGTHADVDRQSEFKADLKAAASKALAATKVREGLDAATAGSNAWAVFDDYIDRVVVQCVNELTPRWQGKLAAFDVYIWDQCYAMEQSLRID